MKSLKIAFVLALFALSCLAPGVWAEVTVADTDAIPGELSDLDVDYVAGEILIGFRPGADPEKARRELGASQIRRFDRIRVRHWKLPRGLSVEKAMAILEKRPNIEYAEPNYLMSLAVLPGDEFFVDLWGMHNVGQTGGTPNADIDAPEAWDLDGAIDASQVVIAVLDTGIDPDHEEFADNLWSNPDGGTYGWDFVHDDDEPIDDHGHGTHVAGTICADGDNAVGVAGVVWSCQLMILKMADASGRLTLDAAIAAIEYASDNGADIISASWGGEERSNSLKNAINAFNGLFVAAAGNSRSSKAHYPAAFPAEHIISVAATDHNDELASFSNYSSRLVDLGAPGVDILSSLPGNQYGSKSGTSMATPHVTGVAAMVMAMLHEASPLEVKAHILESVDPLPALQGLTVTGGRLNAHAAVGGGSVVDPDITPPFAVSDLTAVASIDSWDSIHLSWSATSDDDGAPVFAYDIRYSTTKEGLQGDWENASQVEGEPAPGTLGSPETMTVRQLEGDTTYFFAIRTIDEVAWQSVTSNIATATTDLKPWLTGIVDEAPGALFFPKIAVHPGTGEPAMAYFFGGDAYYATREGDAWPIMTIGEEGSGISLAFDPTTGRPAVSHNIDGSLMFVHYDGDTWLTEEVDSDYIDTWDTSLAFTPEGQPCIFYGTDKGKNKRRIQQLKFACRQGTGWSPEVIATTGFARYRTLAFEDDGTPLLAYSNDTNDDRREDSVILARLIEGSWEFETVTGSEQINYGLSMAYQPDSGPLLIASGYGPIRLYFKKDEVWQRSDIEDNANNPVIAIDSWGMPWVSFRSYDPDSLKVAHPTDNTFEQWTVTIVDSKRIYSSSIAINGNDLPVIGYGHVDDLYLKWAELQFMDP